ncbi:DUF2690 domain-containing protein [Kribbella qitaiheensis]
MLSPIGISPASAAGCYRQGCNNQDPQAMGCSADAKSLDSYTWNGFYVEMRFSPSCSAAWTRATVNDCSHGGSIKTIAWYDWQATQWAAQSNVQVPCYGTTWTKMFSYYFYIQSCIQLYGGPQYCTRTH